MTTCFANYFSTLKLAIDVTIFNVPLLQKLEADQAGYGRYLIDELNVPIVSKEFDADNSEIALGLIVTDVHPWDTNDSKWIKTNKAFSPFKVCL